mmetsp:Transcript_1569/g.3578  ORF Transcript_1569/g.3578 Transcript_1569/m.3578 type:complete len:211 (-) Transcript_1569:66-698(-)
MYLVEEPIEALRRLSHVRLTHRLDVHVPLDVGAQRRLDLQRLLRLGRVEELLHQADHKQLLGTRLAAHHPELRVSARVGHVRVMEALACDLGLVVSVPCGVLAGEVTLVHLLLELFVLALAPRSVKPSVLALRLQVVELVSVISVVRLFFALVFVVVLALITAILDLDIVHHEGVATPTASALRGALRTAIAFFLAVLVVKLIVVILLHL